VVIVLLWIAIALTLWCFFQLQRVAGWLMVPYLLWVTYAAALNGTIWWMN
jgi:tryptophan-rich sensory protein